MIDCACYLLTSESVGLGSAIDVLGAAQDGRLLTPAHGALHTALPVTVGAVLTDPLLLAFLLLLQSVLPVLHLKSLN